MNNLEIFITIHALSTWNELGQSQGHCDTELSERGCFMAQQLAQRKDIEHVKKIYTSDYKPIALCRRKICNTVSQ
ncbi:MAG: histidine phosphatase family protein [Symploca sp. SIO2C1]|nr:histidine phosphatase family protein [Symploca sp. SIO2C1]